MSSRGSSLSSPREKQDDGGDDKNHADNREGVAESQDKGLALHQLTDRDNRLMLSGRLIGYAMSHEVVGERLDPLPHLVPG
jgi:hypothetical protein